jgi:hypothetical protein
MNFTAFHSNINHMTQYLNGNCRVSELLYTDIQIICFRIMCTERTFPYQMCTLL